MAECCGLYIHIPFCKSPCGYCDFYKTKSESVDDDFVDLLLKEASLYSEDDRIKVDTLYFGGGTPSLLSPFQLEKIFRGLSEVFDFSDDLESSILLPVNFLILLSSMSSSWSIFSFNSFFN